MFTPFLSKILYYPERSFMQTAKQCSKTPRFETLQHDAEEEENTQTQFLVATFLEWILKDGRMLIRDANNNKLIKINKKKGQSLTHHFHDRLTWLRKNVLSTSKTETKWTSEDSRTTTTKREPSIPLDHSAFTREVGKDGLSPGSE